VEAARGAPDDRRAQLRAARQASDQQEEIARGVDHRWRAEDIQCVVGGDDLGVQRA
jgi:hypothetical protein